jgi:hypothetical protein
MRGSTGWCALLALGLVLGGCKQRRTVAPPPPPPPPPDAARPHADADLAALLGNNQIGDGGLSGLRLGVGSKRGTPDHFYPDWPTSSPMPPRLRGVIDLSPPPNPSAPYALEFDRKLRISKGLLRACYERALHAAPTLAGEVTLEISLGADGKVLSVATPSSTVGNEIPTCLRAQIPRLRFPAPAAGAFKGTVTVKMRPLPPDAGTAPP